MPYRRPYIGDFERSMREHPDWSVVISEGDSWFSFSDVVGKLDDPQDRGDPRYQWRWCLLRLEKNGDEILSMLSGSQRSKLRSFFGRWEVDALLFSGGGNDIIGPDLLPLLNVYRDGMQAQDVVARPRFERRLRQIRDCYRELVDLLADADQTAKVLVNSYDYAIPSDRPVKLLGTVKVAGPWMLPYFRQRGVPQTLQPEVVRLLIDGFCAEVDLVAAELHGAVRLVRVETRGVVERDFRDEIHPNREGARRVAVAFETALLQEGVMR